MKLSRLWLNEWVDCSLTDKELASQLTLAGLEVDAICKVAGEFTRVLVAHVVSTMPHPDADKLTLCQVDVNGPRLLNIVCGASNVRPGLKVALAMIGANLPGGFKIKESKLRGQLSEGMLCSTSELGLTEQSDGIMELDASAPIGMDLRAYLNLDDNVFDIDLTPNRADCFSVLGLAREVAALNQKPLQQPVATIIPPDIDDKITVQNQATDACPRYCGRVIRGINNDVTSPVWLVERLRRSGLRAIHPVVDVLNYVMLELGQPMHAFDLATIKSQIIVRMGNEEEQMTLLDGQTVSLSKQVLVISDEEKPLAMAGVMGALDSAVQASTVDVLLESAFFSPLVIAGVARKYGLSSDSSMRFERGVDSNLQSRALERATELIISITGGKVGPIVESCATSHLPRPESFVFDVTKVKKLTGVDIDLVTIKTLLEGLGLHCVEAGANKLAVTTPSHRFDLKQDEDLVEEVIRLYGYDKLQAQPMMFHNVPSKTCHYEQSAERLGAWFKAKGYHETINYSFVDPELQETLYPEAQYMQLLNPISSELSQMRVGMWSGLIAAMVYNLHRQQDLIKFFEVGVVFDTNNSQLSERPCVAALITGENGGQNWSQTKRKFDFFDLKGDVQSLCSAMSLNNVTFVASEHAALHPGQSARIMVEGVPSGWIGLLHPRIAEALDITHDVFLFELNLAPFSQVKSSQFVTISKYPQIRRDLSFLISKDIPVSAVESAVRHVVRQDWLKKFTVFDVYMGEGIPNDKKSVAIAVTLQDPSKTLVDEEINATISAIIKELESQFSILLRD